MSGLHRNRGIRVQGELMKVLRPWLVGVRQIEWREEHIELGRHQVLVRHVCTAPSIGTALHLYRGDHLAVDSVRRERPFPYPWLQGYAYGVGRVEETGADVRGMQPGGLVYCMRLTGELAAVRPEELTVLPSGLDPEAAALAFQADVALLGVRAAEIVLGDTVLVMGQGTIGILAVQFARLAGARRVIAADLCDRRLEISRRTGTDVVLNAGAENVPERVRELTAGRGADVVLEASGAPAALVEGARAAAPLARIAVLGWMMAPLQLNLAEEFTPKGLALVVVHSGRKDLWRRRQRLLGAGTTERELEGQDRQFIFELLAAGRLQAQPLVTHRFRLSELARAWEFVDGHAQEYTQVLLVGGEAA